MHLSKLGRWQQLQGGETKELLDYCNRNNITDGIVFHGRERGVSISSVGVWKNLKWIARQIGVPEETVYPHSLRHLFAKSFMDKNGDITELADLLGHSRLETTWVYTKTTSEEKRTRLEQLGL